MKKVSREVSQFVQMQQEDRQFGERNVNRNAKKMAKTLNGSRKHRKQVDYSKMSVQELYEMEEEI